MEKGEEKWGVDCVLSLSGRIEIEEERERKDGDHPPKWLSLHYNSHNLEEKHGLITCVLFLY